MRSRTVAIGLVAVAVVGAAVVVRWPRGETLARGTITATTVVMLGDSITQDGDWAALIPDHVMANRGYSGFTTAQLVGVADGVAADRPAVVFVLTGTNDIRNGQRPVWTARHLDEILDRFAQTAPDTVVVVQTVLPRADAVGQVVETNGEIRAVAVAHDVQLLDLYPAFDDGAGMLRVAETTDGIHLDDDGYRRWQGLVAETLEEITAAPR